MSDPPLPARKRAFAEWGVLGAGIAADRRPRYRLWRSSGRLPPPNPDLPEWFDPAYRVKKNRGIIFAPENG